MMIISDFDPDQFLRQQRAIEAHKALVRQLEESAQRFRILAKDLQTEIDKPFWKWFFGLWHWILFLILVMFCLLFFSFLVFLYA